MQWAQKQKGFTIVELLVVVVVIAILAAVTVVGYNGVTTQANNASAASAVSQAIKKIEVYFIQNGQYPADENAFLDLGFRDGGVVPEYSVNNASSPKGYCVTMTAAKSMYYGAKEFTMPIWVPDALSQQSAKAGKCPGHYGSTDPVKNLIIAANVDSTEAGYGAANGASHIPVTSRFRTGTRSLQVTMPQTTSSIFVGVSLFQGSVGGALEPNTDYFVSAHVYVPPGTVDIRHVVQGAGQQSITYGSNFSTSLKGEWVRIWASFKTSSSGSVTLFLLNATAVPTAGTMFWVDDVALTKGDTLLGFSDGRAPKWSWSGTVNSSVSEGPSY